MGNASKGFLCFRPPSTIEIDDGVDCSADRVLSLIAAARLQNNNTHPPPDSSINQPPATSRRSFATFLRALVFQTSISRRVREAKLRNRSGRSLRELPSDEQLTAVADRQTPDQTFEIAVAPETDRCSSPEIGGGSGGGINPVALVVLLSLLGTVFCGRLCAVMTTTVWIYAWRSGALVVGSKFRMKGKRLFSYKRKVID